MIPRLIYSLLTLYMILILVRWFGAWISVDTDAPRLRWIARTVDPVVNRVRRILPPMGPMDFGPFATLLAVWILRIILAGA